MMIFQLTPENTPIQKRLFDICVSITALLILSPLIFIISIMVVLFQGFPILFRQERPGYHAEIFSIYKFRTMTTAKDEHGDHLLDEKRITKFGHFLRSTSLDELPELFNVIKGEMSLVGPRPLLISYLPLYNETQSKRHNVLPGITGWAQIHGRNALSWQDKFELDVWYVEHWSFWLDIKIIFLTIFKVLKREGISQPGQVTAELFTGNPDDEDSSEFKRK